MAMSRKHYNRVAEIIRGQRDDGGRPLTATFEEERRERLRVTENMARGLACMFEEDNPSFDKVRFIRACGIDKPYYYGGE